MIFLPALIGIPVPPLNVFIISDINQHIIFRLGTHAAEAKRGLLRTMVLKPTTEDMLNFLENSPGVNLKSTVDLAAIKRKISQFENDERKIQKKDRSLAAESETGETDAERQYERTSYDGVNPEG